MRKKWLLRASVLLGICVAALLMAAPAMAIWDWCDVDPLLNIGGHNVSLDAGYLGNSSDINGKITFTVTVPQGTGVSVVSVEPGAFVKIRYGGDSSTGIQVQVSVNIKTKNLDDTHLTVSLEGAQIAEEQGTTAADLAYSFVVS
jgi:hypothetical protein